MVSRDDFLASRGGLSSASCDRPLEEDVLEPPFAGLEGVEFPEASGRTSALVVEALPLVLVLEGRPRPRFLGPFDGDDVVDGPRRSCGSGRALFGESILAFGMVEGVCVDKKIRILRLGAGT